MRQTFKFVVVLALALGSVGAGVTAADAAPDHSVAGGLGCCRTAE